MRMVTFFCESIAQRCGPRPSVSGEILIARRQIKVSADMGMIFIGIGELSKGLQIPSPYCGLGPFLS